MTLKENTNLITARIYSVTVIHQVKVFEQKKGSLLVYQPFPSSSKENIMLYYTTL